MKTKMTMCVFALSALCSFYVCHSKAEMKIWKQDYEAYGRKISINIPVDDMGIDKIEIIRAETQKVNEREVEKTKWSDDADFCKDSGMIETLTEGEESWPVSYLLSEDTFITILYDRSPCELRKYGNGRQLWRDGVSYYPNEINPQDIYAENNNVSLKAAEDYLGKIIEYYYDSQDSDYEIDYVTVNDRARKNGKDVDTYQSGTYEIYFSQRINDIPILGRWADLYDMFERAENKIYPNEKWNAGSTMHWYFEIMNRTSFNGYMMMLEKRDTLYEEKIVSMEKAIESIEKEIYAGRIRNVYSLKLGYVCYENKKDISTILYPMWIFECEYVKKPDEAESEYAENGDFRTGSHHALVGVDAITGEVVDRMKPTKECKYK